MPNKGKRDLVIAMLRAGCTYHEISAKTGLSKATISYHAKKLGLPRQPARPKYDWSEIQTYYDEGHSVRECAQHFGFNLNTWSKAARAGRVKARHWEEAFFARLTPGEHLNRADAKRHLIRAGLLVEQCAFCGIREWRGRPLSLQIDHINGDKYDWRLENLRLLCPNCHSQTDTYAGKNRKQPPKPRTVREGHVIYR